MDSFIYSINATVPVFLVMVLGGLIKKIGIIDEHFANVANRYVFKVALPVLLFRDLSKSDFKSQFEPKFVLYCSIVTILMFSLVWIFTEILMKDDTRRVHLFREAVEAVRRYLEWRLCRICIQIREWRRLCSCCCSAV